jgi:hypothetical protein
MQVEVTQEDLDCGERLDGSCCALALAVRRVTQHGMIVGNHLVKIGLDI